MIPSRKQEDESAEALVGASPFSKKVPGEAFGSDYVGRKMLDNQFYVTMYERAASLMIGHCGP